MKRQLIGYAFEASVAAELLLFTIFLLSNSRRRTPAMFLLAGLTTSLAAMMLGNFLIDAGAPLWLSDINLFLELLTPPLTYLYVQQMHMPGPALTWRDLVHALPAFIGVTVWEAQLLQSMDTYVIVCWFGYLAASVTFLARHAAGYAPQSLKRFLILLLGTLFIVGLIRVWIVVELSTGPFREGIPYLLILAASFIATCQILYTALRYPDLISVPGSHVKYANSGSEKNIQDVLDRAFTVFMDEKKPFLDPDLSLAQLADALGTQSRSLSQLINERHGMNFSALMNRERVNTASKLLAADLAKSVKSVMYESGFRSKSVFNREFQRHFGMSPGEFRRRAAELTIADSEASL